MKHSFIPPYAVSHETSRRLAVLVSEIQRWSGTVNLVANNDLPALYRRHVEDSLQIVPLLPTDDGSTIDLGSGAGFPGLVIAIASRRRVQLVEADKRKAAFLREAGRKCGADVTVHATRIERLTLPAATLVTARALAPLDQLLRWSVPLLAPGGMCLFLKGRSGLRELAELGDHWQIKTRCWTSRTEPNAWVLQIEELALAN